MNKNIAWRKKGFCEVEQTQKNLKKSFAEWAAESAYSSFVNFIQLSGQFDSENNMPQSAVAVNTRSSTTELRGTNGVHPATAGYYQIADASYRDMVFELS